MKNKVTVFISLLLLLNSTAIVQAADSNLAKNKKVFYSTEEGTSQQGEDTHAVNAVDGDTQTRWVAAPLTIDNADYPEWIGVDLGACYDISEIKIYFNTNNDKRKYQYEIYASENTEPVTGQDTLPEYFVKIYDGADNNSDTVSISEFSNEDVKARYVVINITGCTVWQDKKYAAASIKELEVYGEPSGFKAEAVNLGVREGYDGIGTGFKAVINTDGTAVNSYLWAVKSGNENKKKEFTGTVVSGDSTVEAGLIIRGLEDENAKAEVIAYNKEGE